MGYIRRKLWLYDNGELCMEERIGIDPDVFWIDKMPAYFDAYTLGAPSKSTIQKFIDYANFVLREDLAQAKKSLYDEEDDVVLFYTYE